MTASSQSLPLPDADATVAAGERMAAGCPQAAVIYLAGDLGAGKTTLVRGLLRGLGHTGRVKSPTYGLVEPYDLGDREVYHLDLYRLADPEELEFVGLRDIAHARALLLVEWPERGSDVLPAADLTLTLEFADSGRLLHANAHTGIGQRLLEALTRPGRDPDHI